MLRRSAIPCSVAINKAMKRSGIQPKTEKKKRNAEKRKAQREKIENSCKQPKQNLF